ncbi:MAG: carbon storage regulator CsrA [Deferribacterales bacterium]|nr:carbon storage regulator CsrA [Deferribacterales bacterium]
MLVLSRKTNESIMIGDAIEVRVVDVVGKTIKLGIEAPKDVAVHRKEIYVAIKDENLKAVPKENIISLLEYFNKQKK